jgi:hypothetical protein
MAADVTISGSYAIKYQNDDKKTDTDAGSLSSEGDVNIKFSNTTDTGLTTSLNFGMHETGLKADSDAAYDQGDDGAAYDDLNASLSGDFGTLYFDPAGDDVALGGFDEKADKAGEGTDSGMASGYRGGILGASGTTIGYKLPSLVDGLTIALSHGEGASEYFGYGIGYDADMFSIGYVAEATNTVKNKTVSVGVEVAGISFGADQVSYKDDDDATAERKTEAYGVSYSIDSLTLAYEMGKMDNENNNTEVENHKQIQVSYAVAPGITAIVSSSEVDSTADDDNDKEVLELQLKLAF